MGVSGPQKKHAKALQFWMVEHRAHERLRDAAAAEFRDHEDIHQVGKHRAVGYHAGKRNLPSRQVHAEAERVLDRAFDDGAGRPSAQYEVQKN